MQRLIEEPIKEGRRLNAVGDRAEFLVSKILKKLNPGEYVVINKALLPSKNAVSTTQVDHIVVSDYGIFCIETKAHSGSIWGSKYEKEWTQILGNKRFGVFSPHYQNYGHMKAIEDIISKLPLRGQVNIYGYLTFPFASSVNVPGLTGVGDEFQLLHALKNKKQVRICAGDKRQIVQALTDAMLLDAESQEIHNLTIQAFKVRAAK